MKALNLEEMEVIEGGKFWGWDCQNTPSSSGIHYTTTYADGSHDPDSGSSYCVYPCKYYVFGVAVDNDNLILDC